MAGLIRVEQGSTVPIALQLVDGASGLYPQAEVRGANGTLLTTLNLSHQASGLYLPASAYSMPAETFIQVTYIVYTDAGHTTESELYFQDLDVFYTVDDLTQADVQAAMTAQGYTTGRAPLLDNLDAAVSSRSSHSAADVRAEMDANSVDLDAIQAQIAGLNDLSQADVQAALTAQGYTTARAANLDNLDAAISTVLSQIAALNDISITDVQTALTNQGYTTARAVLLDNLVTILASVEKIRKVTTNRVVVNAADSLVTIYEDDAITPAFTFTISSDRRERTP